MGKKAQYVLLLILATGVVIAGAVYYRGHVQHTATIASLAKLEARIADNNRQSAAVAKALVRKIGAAVCNNRYQARDQQVLNNSLVIRDRTDSLSDTLGLYKQQMRLTSKSLSLEVRSQLLAQVHRYRSLIAQFLSEPLPTIPPGDLAPDGAEPSTKASEVISATAALTLLEAQLRRYQTDALQHQAEMAPNNGLWFTRILPVAIPSAETVAPGSIYESRLLLAQLDQGFCKLQITANGKVLTKENRGGMLVKFTVPTGSPSQPDTLRVKWQGSIKTTLHPVDTLIQVEVPYSIVKRATK